MIPVYTVTHIEGVVYVIGQIPQYEFNALVNLWGAQYGKNFVAAPDIAQKVGYTFCAGDSEKLDDVRDILGIEAPNEAENEEEPA